MDVEQQVHRARAIDFDKEASGDVLTRSAPRKLAGLDLVEARLAAGDVATASALARQALAVHPDLPGAAADRARAEFILARAAILSGRPEEAVEEFQQTLASSQDPRLLSWSHIYLGRMLDLDCKREQAVAEYQEALKTRDGQQDTRLAAERGIRAAYAVNGHSCEDDAAGDNAPGSVPSQPPAAKTADSGQKGSEKPQ
jgi:tetratricopeptide (TPR) repeat protein